MPCTKKKKKKKKKTARKRTSWTHHAVFKQHVDAFKVVPLILAFVFTRTGAVEVGAQVHSSCSSICQPGFYNARPCGNGTYLCKPCDKGSFTAIPNLIVECLRCGHCDHGSDIKEPCTTRSDVVCNCSNGHYLNHGRCEKCSTAFDVDVEDYWVMCRPCQRPGCMENPECKKKCPPTTKRPDTTQSEAPTTHSVTVKTVTTASTASPESQTGRTTHSNREKTTDKIFIWLSFVVAVVAFLLLFCFMLLFSKNQHRNDEVFPCWTTKKDLERQPGFKEQRSHHCSSPTTLTFAISEETPMMSLCQDSSAHIKGFAQRGVHTDARRYEHCDRWPAIVLYEIIKEVPLRRWKEFLRLLSVPDQQMERVELETGLGSLEKQYQMLRLWSQRSSASLADVYASLQHMDLSGCAQQLQESLERLQWRPETKQGLTV
ncbi:tumor necrosis factor receptor superfamily member 10A isoform X2 [Fundulus heteroclitus]|uniref:tumor necrosis factor receptor superfamily member 10A isoform X2 n=1 Tax=Fundulus heteroclitus TaxID=8078 RepID=UPI00165C8ADD|nr:tumor necrosis factor receptor superfamily member 10A isoform X2 [Fundulus heteroclitus]